MKNRYRLFKRSNGIFFVQDNVTGKQGSLRVRDKSTAHRIFQARNEAHLVPSANREIARAYLLAGDPLAGSRNV